MAEVWLHPNRRALTVALVLPAIGLASGAWLWSGVFRSATWLNWLGIIISAVSTLVFVMVVRRLRQPRIACRGDEMLFYLRSGRPIEVPLALVEGFLLGQGPSYLNAHKPAASQVSTIVIRLADRATDFAQRDVKPTLGSWCNHYVTIRGTWCEPLSVALVTRLNSRLADAHIAMQRSRGQR